MFPEFDQNRIRNFIQNAGQPCVAIFEIGTRAVRLLVAPKMVPAKWEEGTFCGDSIMPNLGFDVGFTDKHLSRDADSLRSTIDFLNSRTLLLRQKGVCEFSVIGTAWFRWLINADEIARYIEEVTGHQIELIQQEREAELTIAGLPEVLRRTNSVGDLAVDDLVLFFDQGGGSLEVSWMRWGQSDEARPYIGHRKFDRLGTVALRRNFFYYSADESNPDGGRQLRDPEKNRARVFAQVRRIQNEAKIELLENWMDLGALIRSSPSRRAYAVGSCMDAPVHASSSSSGFERVIGCGHVSGLLCGSSTTAGRYGATRTWCKISSTSSWLTDPDAFPDPLSPIFILTVR